MNTSNINQVPIIDISSLYKTDIKNFNDTISALHNACKQVGFFYIKNHSIENSLIQAMYQNAKLFFQQSETEKNELLISKSVHHVGYSPLRSEKFAADVPQGDEKEALEYNVHLESDECVGYPNIPNFKTLMHTYFHKVFDLGQILLEAMALSLQQEKNTFTKHFTQNSSSKIRVLHYPPNGSNCLIGGSHSDYGCLTILHQDQNGGLQVKTRSNEWIDVPPIQDTYVVNIGDLMARWTNDYYVSTKHRVVSKGMNQSRYSIPFFVDPDFETLVQCLPSFTDDTNKIKYDDILAKDWINTKFRETYEYFK